ncbi:MAG: CRISPR system precrRNA processing endoribonuclease RAMP protein Cas6 [Aigarchaeota archaeon]|nr:CRISPR system precrRNA processing endoribonuclease RAMP protein Cas6 [Candidatus Calditenuis fumarioli]
MIFELQARILVDRPIRFQSFSGFAVRGVFYELLNKVDVNYSDLLHMGKSLAPFAVKPLSFDMAATRYVFRHIFPHSNVWLRILTFDRRVFEAWRKILTEGMLERVRLVGHEFTVVEIRLVIHDPMALFPENTAESDAGFRVKFETPTFFRMSSSTITSQVPKISKVSIRNLKPAYRYVPLPLPSLMFRSLARLWTTFVDPTFNYREFLEWVDAGGIAISGFPSGIYTQRLYEHPTLNKWVVGFTGTVYYSIPEDLRQKRMVRTAMGLLKFGELSNVGGGRTAGFGSMKLIQNQRVKGRCSS